MNRSSGKEIHAYFIEIEMKILHINPSYKPAYVYAGVIESVTRLCVGLVEAGHSVHVFTTTANGKNELDVAAGKELDVDGVKVTYFKRITKDPTHASPDLWKHLWKTCNKYDAVHIHSWWNLLVVVAAWICIARKVKIIISPRGMLSEYIFNSGKASAKKWIHTLVGKRALAKSVFHATAQSEYEECTQLIKGWKGFLIPNVLLLSDTTVQKVVNPVFTLLFLSRIHAKKGLELLFRALVNLPFSIQLRIAGTGDDDYIEELKNHIVSLGIQDKIVWLGWRNREQKFKDLMESDCMVLTSQNENFANVVIESLHVGTPVIISEQVGLAPFIRANNLGWVTSLEVDSIRESIIEAFEDQTKRAFVNRNAREIVNATFRQPVLINQYVEHYVNLKGQKLPPHTVVDVDYNE